MAANNLLLVEDDPEICELLGELLVRENFEVSVATDGASGEALALSKSFDVIVLDIMLPEKDGLSVLRDLRSRITTPILMLTAKGDDLDRIIGFELGADDYLPKPFNPRELLARVKALIRRVSMDTEMKTDQKEIAINNLLIKAKSREVLVEGIAVPLTSTEFNILSILVAQPNEVISRDDLTQKALGRRQTLYDRAIDMHVSNLRKKISDKWIKTVRGAGYLYQAEAG